MNLRGGYWIIDDPDRKLFCANKGLLDIAKDMLHIEIGISWPVNVVINYYFV